MQITTGKIAKAQKVVLYGPEGIGKSSLAAQFPDPLFIDTEGSTSNMEVARMDRPTSMTYLEQQIDFVKNNRPCKTLIIDTIDWAEQIVIDAVVSEAGKKSITGFGYGEGFIQLSERMGKLLNRLSDLVEIGINVVLTAHSQIVRFEQPDEMGAYDRYELKLGNKTTARTAALVKEWADMVLFLNYKTFSVATDDKGKKYKGQGGTRTMYATHHPAWDAKNRHNLPDEMPMDYAQIAHIFNAVPQVEPTQAPPVQPQPTIQQTAPSQSSVVETPQAPPVASPEQAPVQNTAPSQQGGGLDPNIPQSLRVLMEQNNVLEFEIQTIVSQKGYYPLDTPIINYDPTFIDGVLVGAWAQVFAGIEQLRKDMPF
ncbi:ATP-binding protein [Sporosarcina sp. 6E9]|uniref:ATP-binding protein n=1 Tax=Sporosarcina sp. 6E9 TaxID=2819235 RepID=UPI001AC4020A|nr:ATP-binding protein [Sporosarcina sp. 6E9]MBO1909676.1 AAA family ATPase [Microvirga sp. 3-52]